MSRRTLFTTITPLPPVITREAVMETFRMHHEMISLNPLVEERRLIKPPAKATPEEYHCVWYEIVDRVTYLPGGLYSGKVAYTACFNDLEDGLQTHCYAPMGLDIRSRWSLGGNLPGEPQKPVEIGMGIPMEGLYIREDVDMRCNLLMTGFVKKTLKKAHETLMGRLMLKTQLHRNRELTPAEAAMNDVMSETTYAPSMQSSPQPSNAFTPSTISVPSPGSQDQNTLYPEPLSIRSNSPYAQNYQHLQADSTGSSPGPQYMDYSYQNPNPYLNQPVYANQMLNQQAAYLPPHFGSSDTLQPQHFQQVQNSYGQSMNMNMDMENSPRPGKVSGGPPVHQVHHNSVELPAYVPQ